MLPEEDKATVIGYMRRKFGEVLLLGEIIFL